MAPGNSSRGQGQTAQSNHVILRARSRQRRELASKGVVFHLSPCFSTVGSKTYSKINYTVELVNQYNYIADIGFVLAV